MPTSRYGQKLVALDGKVWAIGGSTPNVVEIYNVANDSWTSTACFQKQRTSTAWTAHGKIYVAGGSHDNTIETYDPLRDQWVDAGFIPENKYTADATVLNGKVYLPAGTTVPTFLRMSTCHIIPPMDLYYREANASGTITLDKLSTDVADEFASSSAVSVPVGLVTAVDYNGENPSDHTILERNDRNATHQWEEMAPVSEARYAFDGVELLDGKIYFIGGKDEVGAKNITERYDPKTNQWETLAPMLTLGKAWLRPSSTVSSMQLEARIYQVLKFMILIQILGQ